FTVGCSDDPASGSGLEQQLARDVTAFQATMHFRRVGEREHALDGYLQPPRNDAAQHVVDARLPGREIMVDMAEMEARESLRARQDALADVLEGLALGLADADDVAELLNDVEGAVEHGGAVGIDREIDALAIGEVEH